MAIISAYFLNKENQDNDLNNRLITNFFEDYTNLFKKEIVDIDKNEFSTNIESLFFTSKEINTIDNYYKNFSSNDNFTVITNGSIFNTQSEIEQITSSSIKDSTNLADILIQGYMQYGIDIFNKLNGSYVSIILDKSKKKIVVTRDRFGSNLLFITKGKWGIALSSQIKSLLNLTYIKKIPNWDTINKYLFKNYRFAFGNKETFFQGIDLINPNTINIFNLSGELLNEIEMFSQENKRISYINERDAINNFLEKMDLSLEKRLKNLSKKPAFLLSGGLDSPTVASLAARKSSDPIVCYSICYGADEIPENELSYDERDLIKLIVDKHNIDWRPIYIKPNNFEDIYIDMLKHHDEPLASPTWYSHWLLMKEINSDGFQTIFGGDGGDHALAGLYDDIPYYFADLKFENKEDLLDREISYWIKYHDHPVYKKNLEIWNLYCKECFDWEKQGRITNYTWDEGVFRDEYAYEKLSLNSIRDKEKSINLFPSTKKSYLLSKLYQDLVYTSSPPSTRAESINCEKFNIDLRSIFLDYELMEFCWSLPKEFMIRDGFMKYLIRISMKEYLPNEVVWNRKHIGLNTPANLWFRNDLKEIMDSTINWEGWSDLKLINIELLNNIWLDHIQCKNDHMMFLWKIYSLKKWLEKFN